MHVDPIAIWVHFFFFFKQKTAYEIMPSLVGSEMCIRDRAYRIVDFKRNKDGIPAVVERLEYDPNRSANIALVLYKDGERRYILAPKGLKAGDQIQSGVDAAIKAGNTLPMRNIPVGSTVHNVEMKPGKGGQLARSAGTYVQIVARDGAYVTLRLRSGEMRKVEADCRATLGEVGNAEHMLRVLGKAGACLLYTSDAADDLLCVDLGGRRVIKKKNKKQTSRQTVH